MKYELQYAQFRPASDDPKGAAKIGERKPHIIEASSDEEAQAKATRFLAGRTQISLHCLHLPKKVLQPNPEFIPPYDAN